MVKHGKETLLSQELGNIIQQKQRNPNQKQKIRINKREQRIREYYIKNFKPKCC